MIGARARLRASVAAVALGWLASCERAEEASTLAPHRVAGRQILIRHARSFDPRPDRTLEEARALGQRLAREARDHPDAFEELRRSWSDDSRGENDGERPSSPGIVLRGQLSDDLAPVEVALFGASIGEVVGPVETPLGFHVLRRVPIRELCAAHILVRHRDSVDPPGVPPLPVTDRSREEALERATTILVEARHADDDGFAELARARSEAIDRFSGGRLGIVPRGVLPPALDEAIESLAIGEVGGPVETPFGVHVVRRLPVERVLVRALVATRDELERRRARLLEITRAGAREAAFVEEERAFWSGPGSFPPAGRVHDVQRGAYPASIEGALFALEIGELSTVTDFEGGAALFLRVE